MEQRHKSISRTDLQVLVLRNRVGLETPQTFALILRTGNRYQIEPIKITTVRTYHTCFFNWYNTIFDPDRIATHQICHHDIGCKPITNDCYLIWPRDSCLRVSRKVFHDIRTTTRFFGSVGQDRNASRFLNLGSKFTKTI